MFADATEGAVWLLEGFWEAFEGAILLDMEKLMMEVEDVSAWLEGNEPATVRDLPAEGSLECVGLPTTVATDDDWDSADGRGESVFRPVASARNWRTLSSDGGL